MPFFFLTLGEYVSFLPRFSDFIVSNLRGGIICLPAEALTGVYIRPASASAHCPPWSSPFARAWHSASLTCVLGEPPIGLSPLVEQHTPA